MTDTDDLDGENFVEMCRELGRKDGRIAALEDTLTAKDDEIARLREALAAITRVGHPLHIGPDAMDCKQIARSALEDS